MESGFSLGEINKVLRDAFFSQDSLDHFLVAAGTDEGALEHAAATSRKIIDEAGDLVGHHEREIGVR